MFLDKLLTRGRVTPVTALMQEHNIVIIHFSYFISLSEEFLTIMRSVGLENTPENGRKWISLVGKELGVEVPYSEGLQLKLFHRRTHLEASLKKEVWLCHKGNPSEPKVECSAGIYYNY